MNIVAVRWHKEYANPEIETANLDFVCFYYYSLHCR
jgi:hypothetical protein